MWRDYRIYTCLPSPPSPPPPSWCLTNLLAPRATSSAATRKSASGVSSASGPSFSVAGSALSTNTSGTPNPGGLSNCALACISAAAADSTNLTCVCTDANFQAKCASCLKAECQAADAGPALALQKRECGTTSATAAPSATAPFTPSNPAADISASVTGTKPSSSGSPSAKTGAGVALALTRGNGALLAAGLALLGGALGGAFVL
ncbi:hypothetical protein B0H11DRAFT_2269196 [Mycena galericulata]|nr:hypothetical protein B0H11DRAFT_2269196 [Mycena galericulata]